MGNADLTVQDDWVLARLLPTAGIRNQNEQEKRAASALLAVMSAVPDFCHGLLSVMKAPKGAVSTYTELRFKDGDQRTHIPDGAVIIERGKRRWACLVEIKTSGVSLEVEQVSRYLDLAREHGFDGFLTISNEINSDQDALPYSIDKRKLRGLTVRHLSWWRVLTEAIVQHRFRGIADPDQAWIVGELIRYLDDSKSGASGFEGMGQEWVRVREDARNETLRAADPESKTICSRWEQLAEYLCLHLSQELGVDVVHQRLRGLGSEERLGLATKRLAEEGVLDCSIRVPDAVGPIGIEANLRTRRVTTNVEIQAPKEGRPKTRVNWLLRSAEGRTGRSPHRGSTESRTLDSVGSSSRLSRFPPALAHGWRPETRAALIHLGAVEADGKERGAHGRVVHRGDPAADDGVLPGSRSGPNAPSNQSADDSRGGAEAARPRGQPEIGAREV